MFQVEASFRRYVNVSASVEQRREEVKTQFQLQLYNIYLWQQTNPTVRF